MREFKLSLAVTLVGIATSLYWGGWSALLLILMLAILEISLSFDNAIVNVSVLRKMNPLWQDRFLTWGILIAVFGVRFLIPIIIVALIAGISIPDVIDLIFKNPVEYSKHLTESHNAISTFGGIFLLLVSLSFMFDQTKEVHWLEYIEKRLKPLGQLRLIKPIIILCILGIAIHHVPTEQKGPVAVSGIISIILFMVLHTLTELFSRQSHHSSLHHTGPLNFLYLETLDASFSLDGVIGAFAITKDIVLILLGLMIGAVFVRSVTLILLHKGTLKKYQYLAHGAHYGIGVLGMLMLFSMFTPISEIVIGFTCILFIGLSLLSSIRYNRRNTHKKPHKHH